MPQTFDQFTSSAEPSAEDSWFERNKEVIMGAAAGGLALLAKKPIGKALSAAGSTTLGAPVKQFGQGVQGVFAPASMPDRGFVPSRLETPTTAREAESLVRQHMGRASRATDTAAAQLDPHWTNLYKFTPEQHDDLVHYVETRSAGGSIPHPEMQPIADALRKSYKRVESELNTLFEKETNKQSFINDYYRHMYKPKVDEAPEQFLSRIGSGGFLKQRKIPTMREAKAMGYEPITNDPIEMTLRYIQNAEKFIARENILKEARAKGLIRHSASATPHPDKIPREWQPILNKGMITYYAPEGFARVWNNFTSKGMTGAMGDIYRPMQHTFNTLTALELGLSGFHATTMANEAIVSEVARGVQSMFKGKPGAALSSIFKAPVAPYKLYKTGRDVEKTWLGSIPGTSHMRRITDLMEQAGGRAKPYMTSEEYQFSSARTYLEAWQRGALKQTMGQEWQQMRQGVTPAVKTLLSGVGKIMGSVTAPLFRTYIPRLKNGAFYETMSTWLENNPGASMVEQRAAARVIMDSIDNRFGEVIQDNVFWNRTLKQASMLMMRSYSWNLGTVREIGGGVKDIAMGDIHSPRAAYALALPVVFGLTNAVYQFLKTGETPSSEQDLIAPRTGGKDPATGLPERLAPVGYMKDVFGWWEDPIREARNKMASGPAMVTELATGRDWKGDPIVPPDANAPEWLKLYVQHVGEAFVPISIKNQYERKKGSQISPAEAFMGLRPASRQLTDPEGFEAMKDRMAKKEWRRTVKKETRRQSLMEGND